MRIVLKLQKLTPGDICQMNFGLADAREHWTRPDENPSVGRILWAEPRGGIAQYALEGLPNKVLAARDRTAVTSKALLVAEMVQTRTMMGIVPRPRRRQMKYADPNRQYGPGLPAGVHDRNPFRLRPPADAVRGRSKFDEKVKI
jgi:hypothetical protein